MWKKGEESRNNHVIVALIVIFVLNQSSWNNHIIVALIVIFVPKSVLIVTFQEVLTITVTVIFIILLVVKVEVLV